LAPLGTVGFGIRSSAQLATGLQEAIQLRREPRRHLTDTLLHLADHGVVITQTITYLPLRQASAAPPSA
jgi:hypothetical protein